MPAADTHPDRAELAAFALGILDSSGLTLVEAHVATCPDCQERVAQSPADGLVELLQRAHAHTGAADNTLADVLQRAQTPAIERSLAVPAELAQHERYRVVRQLGEGGMGVVYAAEHRIMQRPVALKLIHKAYTANPATVARFRREVRAAARLSHPNIVTAYDAENVGDIHFLVMEFIDGTTLGRLVKARGPLPVAVACDYVRQAALGLQHAHERGMVHRDVKPENLMLVSGAAEPAPGVIKVLDFGLAALNAERGDGLTDHDLVMGTPDYMAPEQAENPSTADIRADVYSLGCTLFYLLTGAVPYPAATSISKILSHREKQIPEVRRLRPEIPPQLEALIAKMLAKNPAQRFQTPGEVAEALQSCGSNTLSRTSVEGDKGRKGDGERGSDRRWLVGVALLGLLGVALAAVAVYRVQTDKGELIITTESDDVEVIVRKAGKEIAIIDTKTDKRITLRSGTYELELKDAPEGLKLEIEKVTLTRGDVVLAKIQRIPSPGGPPLGKIQLVQQIPTSAVGDLFYYAAISPGGKYALVTRDLGGSVQMDVFDVKTAEKIFDCPGYQAEFIDDGDKVVVQYERKYQIYETRTGKLVRQSEEVADEMWAFHLSPTGKHIAYSNSKGYALFDLVEMKELRHWQNGVAAGLEFSTDGRYLFLRLAKGAAWNVWDIEKDRASDEFAALKDEPWFHYLSDGKTVLTSREGQFFRLDPQTGKVARTLRSSDTGSGDLLTRYADSGRFALYLQGDGSVRLFPFTTKQASARYQLPEDDRSLPSHYYEHYVMAISKDSGHATLVTRKSLWIFRLPPVPEKDER